MLNLIQGDCLQILDTLPKVKCIFADPPDNLNLNYGNYIDKRDDYYSWLEEIITKSFLKCSIFWLSYYHKHDLEIKNIFYNLMKKYPQRELRTFIWRFTFGQYREEDFASGYRPIIRVMRKDAITYPGNVRIVSDRMLLGDKRAAGLRVPDDVWEYSRVVGNSKERRTWHPTQHPEELMSRIIRFSCNKTETFVDLFAGTGTSLIVCKDLRVPCIGIEQSSFYCSKINEELGSCINYSH